METPGSSLILSRKQRQALECESEQKRVKISMKERSTLYLSRGSVSEVLSFTVVKLYNNGFVVKCLTLT